MRPESIIPPSRPRSRRLSSRSRAFAIAIAIGLFALLLSLRGISNFGTDYLWFDSVGFDSVWRGVLVAKVVLALIFMALFAMLCWVNLWLADRLAPQYREASPEEEAVARFRELIGHRWGLVRLAVTLLFALSIGAAAASQWQNWLLFTNSVPFGVDDPQFGRDISFFVFRMPFLAFVASWLFTALMVVLVLTVAMHYLAGGIRIQSLTERVTPQVKAHVSVLLAVMALVRAAGYWLDRYALSYSTDGKFAGLGYVDVRARLPVLNLLIMIALLSVVLFVVNIRRRGWGLPAVAVGLWALVSIVMGGIYPLVVQRFSVNPDETTKEAPYVERNITATKEGYGLTEVEVRPFIYDENATGADVQGSERNLASVPLLDPGIVGKNFELQQVERSFFRFDSEADVDRYEIDGVPTQVVVSARELNSAGIPETSWESEVLSFTHGNGIALAPANRIVDRLPSFLIGGVPLDNQLADQIPIEQPRIYFGENMSGYAIANSDRAEVDSVEGGARVSYNYEGTGGVAAGGFWRRAMFALRFQSIDPLISDFVRDDSRFIWIRDVGERVRKVAPFLAFDHNPYPVIVEGRVLYVIDGYTTTDNYPYSDPRISRDVRPGSGLRSSFNYVRNSVKATVDAYDGTITLYIVDKTDPIIEVWRQAFPAIFTDFDDMPPELVDHLRYPEDMFVVQTNMWAKYHVESSQSDDLLEGSSQWSVAQDPGGVRGAGQTEETDALGVTTTSENRVDPYYTLLQLPEENQQEFVILRSFVAFSNDDTVKLLRSFMAGVSSVGSQNYGRLVSYEVENVDGDVEAPGPALVSSQILSQDQISERISLLNAKDEGSSVEFGDLVMVPVQVECSQPVEGEAADGKPACNALLWVRPMFVIATGTERPTVEWIVVSSGDRVVMCHTLTDSIRALFGVAVRTLGSSGSNNECIGNVVFRDRGVPAADPAEDDGTEDEESEAGQGSNGVAPGGGSADAALELLLDAQEALEAGDLGRYQQLVDDAREQLAESLSE